MKHNKLIPKGWLPISLLILLCIVTIYDLAEIVFHIFFEFKSLKYDLIWLSSIIFLLIGFIIDELLLKKVRGVYENKYVRPCCGVLIALGLIPIWFICCLYFDNNYTFPKFSLVIRPILISIWSFMALWLLAYSKIGAIITFRTLVLFILIICIVRFLQSIDAMIALMRSSDLLNLLIYIIIFSFAVYLLINGIIKSFNPNFIKVYTNAQAKWYSIFILVMICVFLVSCNISTENKINGHYGEYAKQAFISIHSHMTEQEALSREVDWYREPKLTNFLYYGELTGKDIISICNKIMDENHMKEDALRKHFTWIVKTYDVNDLKNYSLDHLNEFIASKFHIAGTFTTFNVDNPYETMSNDVLVVRGVNQIIILSEKQNFVTFDISEFSPKWYE